MVYTLLLLTKAINKLYNSRPHLWNSVPSPPLYANFYLTFLPEYKLFLFCVYLGLSSPRLGNKCTPQQKCPISTDIGLDFWQSTGLAKRFFHVDRSWGDKFSFPACSQSLSIHEYGIPSDDLGGGMDVPLEVLLDSPVANVTVDHLTAVDAFSSSARGE